MKKIIIAIIAVYLLSCSNAIDDRTTSKDGEKNSLSRYAIPTNFILDYQQGKNTEFTKIYEKSVFNSQYKDKYYVLVNYGEVIVGSKKKFYISISNPLYHMYMGNEPMFLEKLPHGLIKMPKAKIEFQYGSENKPIVLEREHFVVCEYETDLYDLNYDFNISKLKVSAIIDDPMFDDPGFNDLYVYNIVDKPIATLLYGDVNNDGLPDKIEIFEKTTNVYLASSGGYNFTSDYSFNIGTNRGSFSHVLTDVNGDGRSDLVQTGDKNMWIGISDVNGRFHLWTHTVSTGRYGGIYGHFFADVNGDGRTDLIQRGDKLMWIGISDMNGEFNIWTHTVSTGRYGGAYDHDFFDVNGDKRVDMIQTRVSSGEEWVGLSDISGKFEIWSNYHR